MKIANCLLILVSAGYWLFGSARAEEPAAEVTRKLNAFSEQLFSAELSRPENAGKNLVLFPGGIIRGLLALQGGAEGECQREILSLLSLSPSETAWAERLLADRPLQGGQPSAVRERGVWWLASDVKWNDGFLKRLPTTYGVSEEKVDFFNDPEKARGAANAVGRNFSPQLAGVLPDNAVRTGSKMLAVNLAACDLREQALFAGARPGAQDFTAASGKIRVAALETPAETGVLFMGENFRAVSLPLNPQLRLALYVPHDAAALGAVEKAWASVRFDGWLQDIRLSLPAFSVVTAGGWREPLHRLGMETAFTEKSGLGGWGEGVSLENIFQGGEIALPLTGGKKTPAGDMEGADVHAFKVDRPFLFALCDAGGLVLAMGRVLELPDITPAAAKKENEFSARGYGVWRLGMTLAEVRDAAPECAPYAPGANGAWTSGKNVPWDGRNAARAEFFFMEGKLQVLRLWLAENAAKETAEKELAAAEKYLQKLTGSDYKLAAAVTAKLAAAPQDMPAVASDEVPQVISGMRARVTVLRHPQLQWQVCLTFSEF